MPKFRADPSHVRGVNGHWKFRKKNEIRELAFKKVTQHKNCTVLVQLLCYVTAFKFSKDFVHHVWPLTSFLFLFRLTLNFQISGLQNQILKTRQTLSKFVPPGKSEFRGYCFDLSPATPLLDFTLAVSKNNRRL